MHHAACHKLEPTVSQAHLNSHDANSQCNKPRTSVLSNSLAKRHSHLPLLRTWFKLIFCTELDSSLCFVETRPANGCVIPRMQPFVLMQGSGTPTTHKDTCILFGHQMKDPTLSMLPHYKTIWGTWRLKRPTSDDGS